MAPKCYRARVAVRLGRTVQAWLGHATVEMTMKYLAPQEGEAVQSEMNSTFRSLSAVMLGRLLEPMSANLGAM